MKKDESNDLLLEIICKSAPGVANEFKGNNLYLAAENITAAELGKVIGKPVNEIVAFFWVRGHNISLNQALSSGLLQDYCQSIKVGVKRKRGVNFSEIIEEYLEKSEQKGKLVVRPPIVSIMGHIDHGKTTLLDTICQTQVQKKEAGGITQKVTVSQIEFQGQKITFLDTPGHSDFIKMRQRGISLTDLVVLVIDGKDGVMEQTKEIIDYLCRYELPAVVFINHKRPTETNNENNLNRIRGQCQQIGLTPLEWVSGSAREKTSIQNLLEIILLFSVDFSTKHFDSTHGVVIDSYLHSQTGSRINELLVQGGKLEEKDTIFLNGKFGKAKMMFDICGEKVTTVYPSDIAKVIGLTTGAELGDRFLVVNNQKTIEKIENELANYLEKTEKLSPPPFSTEKKNINLVLVADSQNSLEALNNLIKKKKSPNFGFSTTYTIAGNLNNFALNLTKITNSRVLVFGCQLPQKQIKSLKENNIPFFSSKIIYEIDEKLDELINSQREVEEVEETVGMAIVKVVFEFSKGNIAGCQVVNGKISRNKRVYVLREKEKKKVFVGEIKSLESNKVEKNEISSGQECGIVLKGFDKFHEGDKIVAFHLVKKNVIQ